MIDYYEFTVQIMEKDEKIAKAIYRAMKTFFKNYYDGYHGMSVLMKINRDVVDCE